MTIVSAKNDECYWFTQASLRADHLCNLSRVKNRLANKLGKHYTVCNICFVGSSLTSSLKSILFKTQDTSRCGASEL